MSTLKERLEARAKSLLETKAATAETVEARPAPIARAEPIARAGLSLRERLASVASKTTVETEQAKPWPAPTATSPVPSPAPTTEAKPAIAAKAKPEGK